MSCGTSDASRDFLLPACPVLVLLGVVLAWVCCGLEIWHQTPLMTLFISCRSSTVLLSEVVTVLLKGRRGEKLLGAFELTVMCWVEEEGGPRLAG